MVKKLKQVIPFLVLALMVTIVNSVIDGSVNIKMMKILDYALAGNFNRIKVIAPETILLALILIPLGIVVAMTNSLYKRKANVILKKYYVTKVFQKNIAEFQRENNAKYISSMTNDFNTLETNLVTGIYTVGTGFTNFGVGIWLLSTVDPRLILLSCIVIGINLFISYITSSPTKKAYKERSDLFDGYTSYIKEVLSAFHIIKNNNLQEKVTNDYYEKSNEIQHKGYVIERLFSFVNATESLVMNGSFYGILCAVGYLAIKGKISPGDVLLVVQGVERMADPLYVISENLPKLFTSGNLIDKIEKTLENSDNHEETIKLPSFDKTIVFQDVEFGYQDDDRIVLSDVNLEIKKNGKYLIVGPSGGGKSTLLKLFRKYFNPTKGTVFIDGKDLRDIKKDDYFKLVANVEQQVFIFEDTVRNNITLYKEYTDKEIEDAIHAAGLDDFVGKLPNGLDTIIYDNGKNISGGERSRIVIARALLNKASILFMDEAFASLDMERAREIEKTILNLKDITVINVSHVIFKDTKDLYDKIFTVKKTVI